MKSDLLIIAFFAIAIWAMFACEWKTGLDNRDMRPVGWCETCGGRYVGADSLKCRIIGEIGSQRWICESCYFRPY